jgi:8-oxo-dGTP diphosphatase
MEARPAQAPARLAVIRAAGGVVTRRAPDGTVEVVLVHRPRYDDWSLPKGKLEPRESVEDAAVREVEEETGIRCDLGEQLASQRYTDRRGRPKIVHYFSMTPISVSPWHPNDEIDAVRWIPARDALSLLTYDADRKLVEDVAKSAEQDAGGP